MIDDSYDITAESAVLGAVMASPENCREVFLSLRSNDWYNRESREAAALITDLLVRDRPADPDSVLVEAMSRGLVPHKIRGEFLLMCSNSACLPASVPFFADRIRDLSAARRLWEVGTRAAQRMESAWKTGTDKVQIQLAVSELRKVCDEAEEIVADLSHPPTPMGEFLDHEDERSWLIPGLLERSERIVLTGAEGGGKSVLCSQLAACMAGGLHPFTAAPLGAGNRGIRVLVVDCENSPQQSRRRFRWMIGMADAARSKHGLSPMDWSETMFIDTRPAGIDLLSSKDTAWLEQAISQTAPDLLVLGPLYKLHHLNPNDETAARELVWVLDGLRERHGFALLTEAHAGNGTDGHGDRMMRPLGSSLFRRWPEFGFGLRRSKLDNSKGRAELVDVVSWRGSREERQWPTSLQHSHVLPWTPADPDYYADIRRIA